jgi:NADPH-dependent curcumin reductase CurA
MPSRETELTLLTVACGSISTYNNKPGETQGIKNYSQLVRRRIRWEGFLVFDANIMSHAKERDENVSKWIAEGSLKSIDHVTDGMDNAIEGFLGMLEGKNLGKSILKIAETE